MVLAIIFCFFVLGIVLLFTLIILMFIASVIASIKAIQGEIYHNPVTIRLMG